MTSLVTIESRFGVTEIQSLLKSGALVAGDTLIWNRKGLKIIHKATITTDGKIATQDGVNHKSPSGAAKHLNNGKPVDGWLAWKLEKNNVSLSKLRGTKV